MQINSGFIPRNILEINGPSWKVVSNFQPNYMRVENVLIFGRNFKVLIHFVCRLWLVRLNKSFAFVLEMVLKDLDKIFLYLKADYSDSFSYLTCMPNLLLLVSFTVYNVKNVMVEILEKMESFDMDLLISDRLGLQID